MIYSTLKKQNKTKNKQTNKQKTKTLVLKMQYQSDVKFLVLISGVRLTPWVSLQIENSLLVD